MIFTFFKNIFSKENSRQKSPAQTISEMQNIPLSEWGDLGNSEVIEGLQFSATLQMRTPLKVLIRHGEIYTENGTPPSYIEEGWEGIWLPKLRSEYEIRQEKLCSSDLGVVDEKVYIKYLMLFREIIESNESVDTKIRLLQKTAKENDIFKSFWEKHKQLDQDFPNSFFYRQLTVIEGIGQKTAKILYEHGFKDIRDLCNASDQSLLALQGIGKSLLAKIRDYCVRLYER